MKMIKALCLFSIKLYLNRDKNPLKWINSLKLYSSLIHLWNMFQNTITEQDDISTPSLGGQPLCTANVVIQEQFPLVGNRN